MHYYIDGYNLLFRLMHSHQNLQEQREQIIYDLNRKASLTKLNLSLVFDATFQVGDRTRTHYDALEILFTAHGETADEFIIDELKNSANPRQETVVTSDKKLAWLARRCSAHTESVEEFMPWLDKSYKNKRKQLKKVDKEPTTPIIQTPQIAPPISLINASIEEREHYYESIFERRFQEFIEEEIKHQEEKEAAKPVNKRKKLKKAKPSLQPLEKAPSDMERWLKAFEEGISHSQDDPK